MKEGGEPNSVGESVKKCPSPLRSRGPVVCVQSCTIPTCRYSTHENVFDRVGRGHPGCRADGDLARRVDTAVYLCPLSFVSRSHGCTSCRGTCTLADNF